MNEYEIKQLRLYRQHITNKSDKASVCHDLNGLQAQFTVNVYYGLKIRCSEEITPLNFGEGLVKNWSVRGTVHAFNENDLPIFKADKSLYKNDDFKGYGIFSQGAYEFAKKKEYLQRQAEEYEKNGYAFTLDPQRQKYFSEFIREKISEGICTRDELKQACIDNGMTFAERDSMFDQWGGGMRELCERGFLCYRVCEKKEFMIAPDFSPVGNEEAEREIASRYFKNFAPATVKDFAYYYGCTQSRAKEIMERLPLENFSACGKEYFFMGELPGNVPDIPGCVLLAGFDQLMLGYKKEESLFLPEEHLRGIFNLAGIVMPPVLLNGNVAGRWRKKNRKVTFEMFEKISERDKKIIEDTALELYGEINKREWKNLY